MVIATRGDWVLLFDEDTPDGGPGASIVWNVATNVTVRSTRAEPFAIASDGSVLQRALTTDGERCYAYTPRADLPRPASHCAVTERPAGGVDSGALSTDGRWAALSVSNRIPPVLMRTSDLQSGRWAPIALPALAGTPIYWDGADAIIGGDRSYRCSTAGRCTKLAIPDDATIVPRLGFPGTDD